MSLEPRLAMPSGAVNGAAATHGVCVERLTLGYGRRPVLDDVTLAVEPGSILAVVGPSGCGKTSFLMALNRLTDLVPGCRVAGRIEVAGFDVLSPRTDVTALRRRVGMIFQKPNPFPMSIARNLTLALKEHGHPRQEREATVERSLREVGLWDEVKDRLRQSALALSGGQQQRLCLARALALRPEVLLLDEPCSALDPISAGVVEDLVVQLGQTHAVIIVTHNLAQARRVADRVALFWHPRPGGTLVEQGPKEQMFGQPREELTAAYLTGRIG